MNNNRPDDGGGGSPAETGIRSAIAKGDFMKKKLTVYLPNGEVENFTTGKVAVGFEIENIYFLNPNAICVYFKNTSETVYSNMPFVYQEEPEPKD